MKHEDLPLDEDFYIGEDPKNLPQYSIPELDKPNDFAEPLPEKYLNKFPEYFKFFCKPYISTNGQVKFNLQLSKEFFNAIKIHYNISRKISKEELCTILESELKKCLKDF